MNPAWSRLRPASQRVNFAACSIANQAFLVKLRRGGVYCIYMHQAQNQMHGASRDSRSSKQVKNQVVAGFVIFRRTDEGVKFLLLYRRGSYWNFPKGHFEEGEQSLDTALRETQEETGIRKEDLRFISNFRGYEKYTFEQGGERIHDTVILYLAETKKAEVTIDPEEHSGFAWFTYYDALKTIGKKYIATKRVLKQAHDFIRGPRQNAQRAHSVKPERSGHGTSPINPIKVGHEVNPVRVPPRPPMIRRGKSQE